MKIVTPIFSFHRERGRVNVSELSTILERILPDVIFLEAPSDWKVSQADIAKINSIESTAVLHYMEVHAAKIVPVDLPTPPESFFRDSGEVYNYVEKVSYKYCRLMDQDKASMTTEGFSYLNSDVHGHVQSEIHDEILRILELRDSQTLTRAYEAWCRQDDLREVEMISNIERYGRENEFGRAVFLVGAAHRSSIMKKSGQRLLHGTADLRWDYSNVWFK